MISQVNAAQRSIKSLICFKKESLSFGELRVADEVCRYEVPRRGERRSLIQLLELLKQSNRERMISRFYNEAAQVLGQQR